MAWRVLSIENPAKLSTENNQLLIVQDGRELSIPIEDIDSLIIDNYGINITANLLNSLSSRSVCVVICDQRHLPATVVLPYSQHSRQAKVSRLQIEMKIPLKKQIWQNNIKQKIINQAEVLENLGLNSQYLRECAAEVKSGDSTNRESIAARNYFAQLLDNATRRQPMWYNSALNYTYALIRASLARHLASRGLITSQGIFHHSELNSFNLADDLIEAYRPLIDLFVLERFSFKNLEEDSMLSKKERHILIEVFESKVKIKGKKFKMKDAVEITVESFVDCIIKQDSNKLELPKINK